MAVRTVTEVSGGAALGGAWGSCKPWSLGEFEVPWTSGVFSGQGDVTVVSLEERAGEERGSDCIKLPNMAEALGRLRRFVDGLSPEDR